MLQYFLRRQIKLVIQGYWSASINFLLHKTHVNPSGHNLVQKIPMESVKCRSASQDLKKYASYVITQQNMPFIAKLQSSKLLGDYIYMHILIIYSFGFPVFVGLYHLHNNAECRTCVCLQKFMYTNRHLYSKYFNLLYRLKQKEKYGLFKLLLLL